MNKQLRKLADVAGIGLSWAVVWSAVFVVIALFIGIVRPEDIDPGEGPLRISAIGFVVGFVSGTIFGLILSVAENRKAVSDLLPIRVALWGVLGAAAWPLLTPPPDEMLFLLCPLGAACGSLLVSIARKAADNQSAKARVGKLLDQLLAIPVRMACESNRGTVT